MGLGASNKNWRKYHFRSHPLKLQPLKCKNRNGGNGMDRWGRKERQGEGFLAMSCIRSLIMGGV